MADLNIVADFTDLQLLNRELVNIPKTAKQSASLFEREFNKVERQLKKSAAESQKYYQRILKLDGATKSASQSASIFEQTLRKEESAFRSLKASIDPAYRAQQQLLQTKRTLRAQVDQGNISIQEAITLMHQYRAAQQASGGAINRSNRLLGRSQVITQQAGYQVGDFIVQVQSGTNAFVAFGQQATQVAGTLTLLGGKWVLIGSVLGVAIPLLTAAGAAFMRTRQSADEASDGIETFEDQLKSAQQEIASTSRELERMNRGFETTAELTLDQAVRQAREQVAMAERALQGAQMRGDSGPGLTSSEAEAQLESARESLRLAEERLEVFRNQNSQIEVQNRLREVAEVHAETLLRLENDRRDALLEAGRVAQEGRETREQMAQALEAESEMYRTILMFGEGSRQVEALRAEQAREAYESRVRETTTNEVLVRQAMAHYDAMVRVNSETKRSVESTEALARSGMSVYLEFQMVREVLEDNYTEAQALEDALAAINSGSTERIQAQVRALANELNITLAAARALMNVLPMTTGMGLRSEVNGVNVVENLLPDSETLSGANTIYQNSLPRGSSGGGGGGGSSGGSGATVFQPRVEGLQALQEAIKAAAEEADLFEEEMKLLDQALEFGLVTQDQYNQMVTQAHEAYNQAIEGASEYMETMESLLDSTRTSMEDTLMSIVDGSESAGDAFKSLIQDVLREAYKLLVIKPMMDSLFGTRSSEGIGGIIGTLFNADGNVFEGGSVKAFANGGVVNGPTVFPMNGSQVGIMGEAGPEAIMPLKRGRNGKLGVQMEGGGQSNVTVENHFHISANGDESVRRIVAQEAPRIANLTQQQILDQRARGGALRNTFR